MYPSGVQEHCCKHLFAPNRTPSIAGHLSNSISGCSMDFAGQRIVNRVDGATARPICLTKRAETVGLVSERVIVCQLLDVAGTGGVVTVVSSGCADAINELSVASSQLNLLMVSEGLARFGLDAKTTLINTTRPRHFLNRIFDDCVLLADFKDRSRLRICLVY